jgi:hypothetical protein
LPVLPVDYSVAVHAFIWLLLTFAASAAAWQGVVTGDVWL